MKRLVMYVVIAPLLVLAMSADTSRKPAPQPGQEGTQYRTLKLSQFTCAQFLKVQNDEEAQFDVLVVWLHGYHTGLHNSGGDFELNSPSVENFANKLTNACKAEPDRLVAKAVAGMGK